MHKKKSLYIISALLILSLILPVYYVSSMITDSLFFRSIIKNIMNKKSDMEYFNFIGLEAVLHEKFNNIGYTIYAFADNTKGITKISRNNKKMTLDNMDIHNVYGTAQNDITKDIYQFEGKLMNISEAQSTVRLYQDFNIKLKANKKNSTLEMRGDNITIDTKHGILYSNTPVIFHTEDAILVGGDFTFKDNTVKMHGNIFLDSSVMIITSQLLQIEFDDDSSINGSDVLFKKATFAGNATLLDKTNNTQVSANKIIIDYKKKLAILDGNAIIKNSESVASGANLVYNLSNGVTKLQSNSGRRVQVVINY